MPIIQPIALLLMLVLLRGPNSVEYRLISRKLGWPVPPAKLFFPFLLSQLSHDHLMSTIISGIAFDEPRTAQLEDDGHHIWGVVLSRPELAAAFVEQLHFLEGP